MKYDENYYKQKNIEAEEKVKDILKNYHKNPEHMVEFFEFSSRFYNYSINNTILIYSQNKEASFVQGFNAWKKMGYSVKRGQHGMAFVIKHYNVMIRYIILPKKTKTAGNSSLTRYLFIPQRTTYVTYRYNPVSPVFTPLLCNHLIFIIKIRL